MKVYAAGLIDKSMRAINTKLRQKLVADCRKTLHASRKAMFSQELNSFIVLSGEKNGVPDHKIVEEMETGRVYKRFKKYYKINESKLQKQLKKVVKEFSAAAASKPGTGPAPPSNQHSSKNAVPASMNLPIKTPAHDSDLGSVAS